MMMDQLIRGPGFMPPPQARPPMALNLTDPSPNLSKKVRKQIDYYFSEKNLVDDHFLKNLMDEQGWVSVQQIKEFKSEDLSLLVSDLDKRDAYIDRDHEISKHDFVFYSDRLIRLVVEHGLGHLPFMEKQVVTPTGHVEKTYAALFMLLHFFTSMLVCSYCCYTSFLLTLVDFKKYTHYSDLKRKVFLKYDPYFVSSGLDEAYLDITEVCKERAISSVEGNWSHMQCWSSSKSLTCKGYSCFSNDYVFSVSANEALNMSMVKSPEASLGPICNAHEIFQVFNLVQGTHQADLDKAVELRNELASRNPKNGALASWSGDPCLPLQWEGLQCEPISDKSFIIVSIDVSSKGLNGSIPTVVAELTHLKYLLHGKLIFANSIEAMGWISRGLSKHPKTREASKRKVLDWPTRISIALGAARGK
ncbi:hypothetical protein Sjap_016998 [Stephania japonica]|uniref:HTH La-type RNA-binding domain-containing protein n=1 Tax=Stephania japonica TaxID=461633 RepID=A0AAP0NIW4_9MAGN